MSKLSIYATQYPRKKHILWNLSQLLNQKTQNQVQVNLVDRFLLRQIPDIKRSSQTSHISKRNQRVDNTFKKKNLKINFQHYRTKSSLKSKKVQEIKLQQEKRKSISQRRFNNQLHSQNNINSSPTILGISLSKSYQNKQLFNKVPRKNHNYVFREEMFATQKFQYQDQIFTKSLQLKKRMSEPLLKHQSTNLQESKQNFLLGENKKQFLKKGSSLQKQIVINLLRNKMIKQYEYDLKKQYTRTDILSMIKLYKGFHKNDLKNPQSIVEENRQRMQKLKGSKLKWIKKEEVLKPCPLRIVQKFQKPIEGWEIDPEFQIEDQKGADYQLPKTMQNSEESK